jgi:hypothetical protein
MLSVEPSPRRLIGLVAAVLTLASAARLPSSLLSSALSLAIRAFPAFACVSQWHVGQCFISCAFGAKVPTTSNVSIQEQALLAYSPEGSLPPTTEQFPDKLGKIRPLVPV